MPALISFFAFTLLVGIISYWATRKTDESSSDGYFLGGRSLSAGVIAGSLLLTNLSTEQIVGLNAQAYREGILVMAWDVVAAVAMVFTAIFLLPRYLRGGLTTIPQFLEKRYDKGTKTIASTLFLLGYATIFLPIVLYSGSLAISTMFNVPENFGLTHTQSIWMLVWSIGSIGSIYAILGGLKAVAVSDTVNAIGLLVGGLLIPAFGLMFIGDGSLTDGLAKLVQDAPEKFNALGASDTSVPFSTLFTGMILVNVFYWGTNQAIIQRALSAKSLKEGQKGVLLAAFIKILVPTLVVLPGIIAFQIFGGGLETPDQAYPMLVNKVLPNVWLGFFAAVMFGAILSSFNSALNSSVTLFGIDIYKEYHNKNATERQVIRSGKRFGILLTVISMTIAPFIEKFPEGLYSILQEANGFYSIPILTIIIVGYLTKRVPAIAAKIGILSGSILYLISQFVIKRVYVADEDYPHYLHVMAILFVLNVTIMLVIGKMYPNKEPFKITYTKQVDITPFKYVKQIGGLICAIVVFVYWYFS